MAARGEDNKAVFPEQALGDNGLKQDGAADLFLLIFVLPRKQGMEVCRLIRRDPSCTGIPLAVVKLLSQEAASFLASDCVFDASLQLPESGVMFERIKSLLGTKARQESLGGAVIEAGDLIIDPTRYEVICRGKPAMLTTLEFHLLHYLAARRNRAFTRNQLFTALWGGRSSNPRVVDVYVRRIRLKIEPDPNRPVHLRTLVGRGYQFV